jgi:hypothetical protein
MVAAPISYPFVTYSLLVSRSKFLGSSLKSISLGDVFIYVAWGSPGTLIAQLEPGIKAWSIGISDEGELLNPVGDIDALKPIFMGQGLIQVSQNAGIKCKKGVVNRVKDAIAASGIEERLFFSSVEEDEWDDIFTWRADFDLINQNEDDLTFDSSELYTSIFDEDSGELRTVAVENGNSRLASVVLRLGPDLLAKSMICYVADGSPVTKGNDGIDTGLYIGPRNYIIIEAEAEDGEEYAHFRLDCNGVEDLS